MWEARNTNRNDPKNNWLRKRIREDRIPLVRIIESIKTDDPMDTDLAEVYWIARYRAEGANLMNSTDGGEGVVNLPADVRHRTAEKRKGWHHSQKSRDQMSATKKGMVSAFKGKHHTPEAIAQNSAKHKGKSTWNKGLHHTPDEIKKLSDAMKGKPWSEAIWAAHEARIESETIPSKSV